MSSVHYKSDDEYSVIGDKGDIGFIDLDNCKTICSYNPSEESEIVHISVPFPLVEGKPQSGIVGETVFDTITLQNVTDGPLDLWSVSIYDAKPENSFTISVMEPPTAESDEHYIQDFMEAFTLEDRVLRTDEPLTIWLSCKPKEIGLHSAAVHFSVGDETIERLVFVLAEDKISQSLSSAKPFYRARKKKQNVVGVHTSGTEYVVGRRPTAGLNRGFRYRLPKYPIPENIREMLISGLVPDEVNEGLTKRNYVPFFKTLIAMEEIKLEEDMRAYDMESVIMKSKLNLLTLEVPGLAEKRPSLVNGDHIFVKSAFEQETAKAYQGFIHRVEAEEIFLKFQDKFHTSHRGSTLYNVQFAYNRTGIRRLYQAIEAAESLDRNFLFPSFAKARVTKTAPLVQMISCNLNEEQTSAIQMILACEGGVPYVIHGPPGTGKTMTLIEAILQVYSTRRNSRILVCAPSNSAADHILERLIRGKPGMLQPSEIFRLNAFTRPFEDLNPDFVDYCFVEDFIFKCPSRWELEQYRIIISTYTSASLLYVEGVKRGHFSYIFLDEAGQASEPDTMVPVSQLYTKNTVVVLAGDPRQLGPIVFSKDAESYGLGTSYLERLFQCELYSAGNSSFMTKLVKNYRTHPSILSLPSKLFYDGELIPCKEESRGLSTSWEDFLPNKEFPLLFVGIQGCDEREGSNPSWFNRIEASKVVETIRVLIEKKGLKEEEVGVITPYRQQVLKIRGALESINRPNIKVGSVEQFQGQEREVIIISTVRSTVKHNEFDQIHYLGFLSNSRRFNVAITRSRSLLIVIGNPHILCKDPNWNELLWYCVDNGSYKGCFLPEREEVYAAGPGTMHADTQYSNYEVGKSFQPSEGQWGDKGDNWQSPEVQWGEQGNSFQPSEGQWGDKGDNWQSSEVQWGEQGNSLEASDAQLGETGNNWAASDAQWGEKGNNRKASNAQWGETGNNLAASDAQWGDKGNNWAASNAQWGGKGWAASDAQWGDKKNNWAASNAQWAKKGNSWETSDSQWGGNGNNWQTSDAQWGGNGNNWESSEEQGVERENNWEPSKAQWVQKQNNWKPTEAQLPEKENKREPSKAQWRENKREPSEARWRKKENKQEPSEVQLTKSMDNLKPFENKWGDDEDSLKAAEVQVSIEEKKQSAASLTQKMDNLKPFEGKWGDEEDDWKAAEVQVSVEENNKQSAPSTQYGRNHFQPSDVPWE